MKLLAALKASEVARAEAEERAEKERGAKEWERAARASAEKRVEDERAVMEAERTARLQAEGRAEKERVEKEAAKGKLESAQLAVVLNELSTASFVPSKAQQSPDGESGTKMACSHRDAYSRFRSRMGWDPVEDPKVTALLARVTPAVVACVWGRMAPVADEMEVKERAPGELPVQRIVSKVLCAAAAEVGSATGGKWVANEATQPARKKAGDEERCARADYAWMPNHHRVANLATVTVTAKGKVDLDDVVHLAVQQGALRLHDVVGRHFFEATPGERAVIKPWTYSLCTDGKFLVVVRLSVVPASKDTASFVLLEQSVALPLWDTAKLVLGVPAGLAVLVALMLAKEDELGSAAVVPPAGLGFVHVPRSREAIGDAAAWAPAMPLADDSWWLLGSGGHADVYACVAGGVDVVVKAARHPRRLGDCSREARVLAVLGNAPGTPSADVACQFIPRLLGGAWQETSLVALVLAGVGVTLAEAVARVHGAARWAVVVHAIDIVLQALLHAHTARVAHRDVRASNIILSRAPRTRASAPAAAAFAAAAASGGGSGGSAGSPLPPCSVCLNDWGVARVDATPDDMGRDLCAAKLLLLELGSVSLVGARAHAYEGLPALPASAALVASCDGFPSGAVHVSHLEAFLMAACVPAALAALAPLHAALAPQLGALEWVVWREVHQTAAITAGVRDMADGDE